MTDQQHGSDSQLDMDLMLRLAQRSQSRVLHRTPAQAAPARPAAQPISRQ